MQRVEKNYNENLDQQELWLKEHLDEFHPEELIAGCVATLLFIVSLFTVTQCFGMMHDRRAKHH